MLWGLHGTFKSLGKALFFTLGGYMMGMHLMRMIGDLGQYHQPISRFFGFFLGWHNFTDILASVRFLSVRAIHGVFSSPGWWGLGFFGYLRPSRLTHAGSVLFHTHPGAYLCCLFVVLPQQPAQWVEINGFYRFYKFLLGHGPAGRRPTQRRSFM